MPKLLGVACLLAAASAAVPGDFQKSQQFLKKNCFACHQGKAPAGGFALHRVDSPESLSGDPRQWKRVLARVRDGEMPPAGAPAPSTEARARFVTWLDSSLRTIACADGVQPPPAPLRRLNRSEYAATVRDLLNVHFNAAHALPADGAGGEGFDNAAETLFLSPIHAEKDLAAAKAALEYGAADSKARARFLPHEPGPGLLPAAAARKNIELFLPRAFRRPTQPGEVDRYLALYAHAYRRQGSFDRAMLYALRAVLVSPHFLFRIEPPNPSPAPRPVPHSAFASRLSYFLWGSMPDETLTNLAAKGELHDEAVLAGQVTRMLTDARAREFAEQFVEQWLGTRELGRDIKPDAKLFPTYYDAELQSAIRYEPVLFFQEMLARNLPLLNLLDSDFTILTNKLARHYDLQIKNLSQQPKPVALPENSRRGGLLGMAAVLAVSSLPQRTSPVLRGKWVLDSILGTPPPPPPPDVPELQEEHGPSGPKTMRERLEQHRRNPACATCHSRIDPLGFALENYDVLGRWRDSDSGHPVDAAGELPDGVRFTGAGELKHVLKERRALFIRNLTAKMMGYALGRGLTLEDECMVDEIAAHLEANGHSSQDLVKKIVLSAPFRLQAGAPPSRAARDYDRRK